MAGAIKSGAAEKLLSGILSSGGQQQQQSQGYAPQNAVSRISRKKGIEVQQKNKDKILKINLHNWLN